MNMRDCNMNMPMRGSMSSQMTNQMSGRMSAPMPGQTSNQMSVQMPMQTKEALLKQINEASFAMDDVLLFLDTHPDDAAAMQYYHNVTAMRKNAMDAYQNQFGPLMVDNVMGNRWDWVTEKWPWEGGC